MKRAKVALLLISCATVLSLSGLPARADSWDRDRWDRDRWDHRSDDRWDYDRNDRWDNDRNDRWNRGSYRRAYRVRSVLDRLANHTTTFQFVFDRELDRSRLDGSRREDRLNERVRAFNQLVYIVRNNHYDGYGGRPHRIRELLSRGYDLNSVLQQSPRKRYWLREWRQVQEDLRDLERVSY
jgi:hypothetical protein